ncbi:MAG: DUF4345 family protein [Pseudomonadota bacterium]
MSTVLKWLAKVPPLLLGLMFLAQGVLSLVKPAASVESWGFPLPDGGPGMSGMIGLMASYCLTLGLSLLISLFRKERFWLYAPMMMFFFLGLGRLVAGLAHGAAFMPERFVAEFVFVLLLYLSSRAVASPES